MGHAGALTYGASGTIATKTERLTAAGARVFASTESMIQAMTTDLAAHRRNV